MRTLNSSRTNADGTIRTAEFPDRNQSDPNLMLARPAGSASHPTARLKAFSLWAVAQTWSGIATSTR